MARQQFILVLFAVLAKMTKKSLLFCIKVTIVKKAYYVIRKYVIVGQVEKFNQIKKLSTTHLFL